MSVWIAVGAVNAALSVAAGAFGAHALKARLSPDLQVIFETGARYHMYHSLGLILLGLLLQHRATTLENVPFGNAAGWSLLVGILLFSGSLYTLALSGVRALGAVTPFGGVAFLVGWVLFAVIALRG